MPTLLITGAGRGIGLALTRAALARGDSVVAGVRDPSAASGLHALEGEAGERLTLVPLDVTDGASLQEARALIGSRPIDVLVNNAGVIGPERQDALDMDYEGFLDALDVNTLGPLRVSQAFLPNLRAARAGPAGVAKIVSVTSRMGSLATPNTGRIAYRASKAALNKAMQALALELQPEGIAVCVVHPGWVRTDMGGGGADLAPEESAAGLLRVIDGLTLQDTGAFRDWDGSTMPW